MGSPVSAVLAELVMPKVERVALETSLVPIRWWKRYVDDSNACLKSNDEICFLNHLNSINPNIRFTIETPSYDQEIQCMPFLDTEVSKLNNGEILTKVHWKSTHTDKYLIYDSHNPRQDKKAVVKSLINRAEIVPSTRELKKQEKEKVSQDLSLNGYTKSFINNACKKLKQKSFNHQNLCKYEAGHAYCVCERRIRKTEAHPKKSWSASSVKVMSDLG